MKRNLLLLAVMIITVFSFSSLYAACPQAPNDNGNCDTIYMQVWPADVNFNTGLLPMYAKIPLYVWHDTPNPVDSIAAFVIPLCYSHNNAAKYCSVSYYNNEISWNTAKLSRSVFRNLPTNDTLTATVRNWMMDLYYFGNDEQWDAIIIDLKSEPYVDPLYGPQVPHFWLSCIPQGSADSRFGDNNKRLIATMTFKLQDSMTVCIDTCFWAPSSRLAFSRSDAVTYIPRMDWKNAQGEGTFCHDFFIIPNIPPVIDSCPVTQSQHEKGAYTAAPIYVHDPDCPSVSTLLSIQYSLVPPTPAITLGSLVPAFTAGGCIYSGALNYTVNDHCAAGASVQLIVTDNAQGADTCYFGINLTNTAPVITCPGNDTVTYVAGYTGKATATDADHGDVLTFAKVSGPTGLTVDAAGNIAWSGLSCTDVGDHVVTVKVTDDCLAEAQCSFTIHVTNDGPITVKCPNNGAVKSGDTFTSSIFSAIDPEGRPLTWSIKSVSPLPNVMPTIVGNTVVWATTAATVVGDYIITLEVADECGLKAECNFTVNVFSIGATTITIGEVDCAKPGDFVTVPITISNSTGCFGGFELEVEFDYTSMTFVGATRGGLINAVRPDSLSLFPNDYWFEKFDYRMLPCPTCACCKYKILMLGMFDVPNGVNHIGHPICGSGTLVNLNFVVNNDEKLRGYMIPVCFEWDGDPLGNPPNDWDCGENTFSSVTGDTLYVDGYNGTEARRLCRFNPLACHDDAPQALLVFQSMTCGQDCGGVLVCPATPTTCKRGDINYNTLPYEVADAVLFANYFAQGTQVFIYNLDAQICATDVNADGRTLTLSDLVYLIRVILHDAVEIPKLAPASVANVIVYNNTITVEGANVGAILFEFDSAVNPTLLATNMEMVAGTNKVLVYMNTTTGQSLDAVSQVISFTGDAKLVSVTAVDRDTRVLTTTITAKVAPTTFALHPAYPNPFNPNTNLSFTLPGAANYSLKIYNVAGQLVRTYEGSGVSGLNVITWNGQDNAGSPVSSGVYFFKLIAGQYSATQKMVMMK